MSKFDNLSPEDAEYVLHLPYHLASAGKPDDLDDLWEILTEFEFLEYKVSESDPQALIEDYDLALQTKLHILEEKKSSMRLIQRAIRQSTHVLLQDKTQLGAQLWGRLQLEELPEIKNLLEQVKESKTNWLRPSTPSLASPTGKLLRTLTGHSSPVTAVTVTPDGRKLISGSSDETLKIWNLESGKEECTLSSHPDAINALVVTPDGKQVISGSNNETLKIWDLKTGQLLFSLPVERKNTAKIIKYLPPILHSGFSSLIERKNTIKALAITPNGKQLISIAPKRAIVLDLETKKEVCVWKDLGTITAVTVTSDRKQVVFCSLVTDRATYNRLTFKNLETNQDLSVEVGGNKEITAVAISPNGKQLIFGFNDYKQQIKQQILEVWNLDTRKNWLRKEKLKLTKKIEVIIEHIGEEEVTAIAITPDGKQFITSSADTTLRIWNL